MNSDTGVIMRAFYHFVVKTYWLSTLWTAFFLRRLACKFSWVDNKNKCIGEIALSIKISALKRDDKRENNMTQTTSYQEQDFAPIVVADIGGTNARFAVVTNYCNITNQFEIQHQLTYPSAQFQSFEAALNRYFEQLPIERPVRAPLE